MKKFDSILIVVALVGFLFVWQSRILDAPEYQQYKNVTLVEKKIVDVDSKYWKNTFSFKSYEITVDTSDGKVDVPVQFFEYENLEIGTKVNVTTDKLTNPPNKILLVIGVLMAFGSFCTACYTDLKQQGSRK